MTVGNSLTNTNPDVVRIFIVRHGQTDHNVKKILQGHLDIDVNANGVSQAQKVGERFKSVPVDGVITSDLIRCRSTTAEILRFHPDLESSLIVTEDLRERFMGAVEGMAIKDAVAKYCDNFRNLGEDEHALVARVGRQWDRVVEQSIARDYKNYVICTHGGVITAFSNHLYRSGFELSAGLTQDKLRFPFNTSVTVVDIKKDGSQAGIIQVFGDTAHLGQQLEVADQRIR